VTDSRLLVEAEPSEPSAAVTVAKRRRRRRFRIRRLRARLEERALSLARQRALRHAPPPATLGLERLGSDYGGWIVPTAIITDGWIAYCGGVGEDITFDLALIERSGCSVYAFDPTPRAVAHVSDHAADAPRFHFMPVGLWSEDTVLRFFAPQNPDHVSHSIVNLQGTESYFEAPCRSLDSLMRELGHDRIDLLKVDIEGAEHRVIRSMLGRGIRPTVICTEIDQPVKAWTLWRTVRRIRSAGYDLVAVDRWNLTFIRREIVDTHRSGAR
jgi:FkbM family methyltransferase